jgi:hypothetical protein
MRAGIGLGRIFWLGAALAGAACSENGATPSSEAGAGGAAGHAGHAGVSASGGQEDGEGGGAALGGEGPHAGAGGESASGGATVTAGSAGRGSVGGSAGAGGAGGHGGTGAGQSGTAGGAGSAGNGTAGGGPGACDFTVNHTQSPFIGTVRVVSWATGLPNVTEAHIEFGLADAEPTMSAPVDLNEERYRTLLLGMKAEREYAFRIVAGDGETTCTSDEFSFTTGALPSHVPAITKTAHTPGGFEGFIVTSPGVATLNMSDGHPDAYIFDTDGDVVWWSPSTEIEISRSRLSWDAKAMWSVRAPGGFLVRSVSMDGSTMSSVAGVEGAHHDFAPLPGGGVAALTYEGTAGMGRDFITEVAPDGTATRIAEVAELLEPPTSGTYHPNALRYHPEDDTFTLSDLNTNAFVKLTRSGEVVWQLGGQNPRGQAFTLVDLEPWLANHGHDQRADGHFLFFNNGRTGEGDSKILEVKLDETTWTATKTWEYADAASTYYLGDVAYLPNGNVLVTYSNVGLIQEVDSSGAVVQSFQGTTFGYVEFRTSLYGPPLH